MRGRSAARRARRRTPARRARRTRWRRTARRREIGRFRTLDAGAVVTGWVAAAAAVGAGRPGAGRRGAAARSGVAAARTAGAAPPGSESTVATAPDTPALATATVTATLAASVVTARPPADAAVPPAATAATEPAPPPPLAAEAAPPAAAAPPPAAAAAPPPPDRPAPARMAALRPTRREDREERGEGVALPGDREPERVARDALAKVAAQRAAAQQAAARNRELLTDGLAGSRARVALGDQRRARLEDERLHLRGRDRQDARDLRLTRPAELEQHERLALVLRQAREVVQQLAQIGAAPDILGEAVEAGLEVLGHHRGLASRRQHGATAIAGDGEQPRPHRVGRRLAAQRAVSAQEGLLQRVLAVLVAAEHVAAERQQRRVVPVVERLERTGIALADERGEPRVVQPVIPARSRALAHALPGRRFARSIPSDQRGRPADSRRARRIVGTWVDPSDPLPI